MADQIKRVVERDSAVVDNDGSIVRESTQETNTKAGPKITVANIIWYMYGFVAIVLAFRFILKLFGANPSNSFVTLVYDVSSVLSAPFGSIFGVVKTSSGSASSVFEPSVLVAIAVYALIAWGAAKLLTLNERQ